MVMDAHTVPIYDNLDLDHNNSFNMSSSHHNHIVLFYKYFLPSTNNNNNNHRALTTETLRYLRQNATHYLPLLQSHQSSLCQNMKGRILLSTEGINGTLSCGSEEELRGYMERMEGFDLLTELGPCSNKSSSDGVDGESVVPKAGSGHLFANIDWKTSTTDNNNNIHSSSTQSDNHQNHKQQAVIDPFPDLKIQIVKEIVNTGGTIHVDEIPNDTGNEISAEEFHAILLNAQKKNLDREEECLGGDVADRPVKKQRVDNGGGGEQEEEKKEIVLIDVRNTFEHAIGHFVHPTSSTVHAVDANADVASSNDDNTNTNSSVSNNSATPAINPNTVTFSHFDSTFCSANSQSLQNKKVLMYCTGGIRCVKASAMLKQRGVTDVSHLSGGIHRYLERYGDSGFYRGKVFVFDQRVALDAGSMLRDDSCDGEVKSDGQVVTKKKKEDVVGKCIECQTPYDEISGANLCSVCRDLILICPSCREKLYEFHCERHQGWKDAYFTFLERFTQDELKGQKDKLQSLLDSYLPAKKHKNVRKTLRKQMEKIDARLTDIKEGNVTVDPNARRRCRTCFESDDVCDGRCWGFWKHSQSAQHCKNGGTTLEPILDVKVGDRVTVGPNWNEIRLGSRGSEQDPRLGTVVNIKSWASGGEELDCVAVKWDKALECDRRRKTAGTEGQCEIYRWGVVARNGQRMYDVCKLTAEDGEEAKP